jgi:hypothetical protein
MRLLMWNVMFIKLLEERPAGGGVIKRCGMHSSPKRNGFNCVSDSVVCGVVSK